MRPSLKWLLAIPVVLTLLFFSEGPRSYRGKKRYAQQLEQKLLELRLANKTLSNETLRLKNDPRAIEQIARRELGLIQPGEMEYRFVVRRASPTP